MRGLLLAGLIALAGCKKGVEAWNEEPETVQAKQDAHTTEQDAQTRKTLPLPAFPTYPNPVTSLGEGDDGLIYFQTKSPYDFSRVLNGFDVLPINTGKGTLVLPAGASAQNPVPAMVILHGSGGIKKGREFNYAKWFAENGIAGFVVDYYAPRGVSKDTPYQMPTPYCGNTGEKCAGAATAL